MVTAIAGVLTPYTVEWRRPGTSDTGPWPTNTPSCVGTDGSLGLPAVRIAQWVSAFGPYGLFLSVCQDNFGPSLDRMAMLLNQAMSPR